jgi:hypothetical protein
MTNVSGAKVVENTHFMFTNFVSENFAVFEVIWKNMIQPERPQMAI